MIEKIGKNILFIIMINLLLSISVLAGTYSGGSGTSGDPYQTATTGDLIELSNTSGDWGSYFIQTADITFDADETQVDWDNNSSSGPAEGFSLIGNSTTKFTGSYDGGGYTIDNLFINRPSTNYIGLFGYTNNGATIDSIGVTNVDITGSSYVGGLLGFNDGCTVSNSYSTGSVSGDNYVGGLVGVNNASSTVSNSYSTGNVNGSSSVGGLVGYNSSSTVSNSYSTGSVTGSGTDVGGLVGWNNSSTVSNSYSTGSVTGSGTDVGALVGNNNDTVNNSFWDKTVEPTDNGIGTGLTTTQMQYYNSFTDESNTWLTTAWDMIGTENNDAGTDDYWDMDQEGTVNNGYPILSWQDGADDILLANQAPILGGAFTTDGAVDDNATISPFSQVTVSDSDGDNISIDISYTGANGTLTGSGITGTSGNYTLTADTPANVTTNLQALVFIPTENQVSVDSTVDTTFTLTPNDGTTDGTADSTTKVTATSINDAPDLSDSSPTFTGITRFDTNNSGKLISGLLGTSMTDVDTDSQEGIAITGVTNGHENGKWQYTTNSSIWIDMVTVSDTSAVLLEDTHKLRYIPANESDDGNADITYRAWDRTSSAAGSKVDTSTNGGETAFSTNTETATIDVTAYGDPYMDVTFDEGVYGEDDGTTPADASDFTAELTNVSGTTAVTVDRVTEKPDPGDGDGAELTGGETTIRVFLTVTGTPNGSEFIAVKPANSSSLYDKVGNAVSDTQTTDEKRTRAIGGPL